MLKLKNKTLRYQINCRIFILSIGIFLIGGAMTIWQAKRAVEAEMQSSIHLAVQLISFNLSQTNARNDWLAQLNALKETRHLQIQLKEPSGNVQTISQSKATQVQENPPKWFVNLVGSTPIQIERTLITNKGEALILLINANPLNEISEVWQESSSFFGLLFLLILSIFAVIQLVFNRVLKAIFEIVQGLQRVELGNFRQPLPNFFSVEINQIANAINQLTQKLNTTQQENRALTQTQHAIQEQERQHLAQELHDELGQSLTAIKVMTVAISRTDKSKTFLIQQSTESIVQICDHLMSVVRSMMQQLHPLILTELGLKAALEDLISNWQMRHAPLKITFNFDKNCEMLPETIRIHIFRIVQECLTNIIRHANATQVWLNLTFNENNFLMLQISDNGQGCEMQNIKKGFGLLSMRERIRSLDGEFLIETTPTFGMKIIVRIPL
jgi:two-component system sensor histidine kinase UhpB